MTNTVTKSHSTVRFIGTNFRYGVKKLRWSVLNNQPLSTFIKTVMLYVIPLFIWLFLIILTNVLPRPYILTKFLLRFDNYIFDIGVNNADKHIIGPVSSILCVFTGSLLLQYKYYNFIPPHKIYNLQLLELHQPPRSSSSSSTISSSLSSSSYSPPSLDYEKENLSDPFDFDSATEENPIHQKLFDHIDQTGYVPYNSWLNTPIILLDCAWVIINILHSFKDHVTKSNNIIAWAFYVIVHLSAPIVVLVWLYLFHPPNSIKLFITGIGFNNILIALIHLIFPNAPPLFIKLYGETKAPTNELPYTDGIMKQDMKLGDALYRAVYYVAPNKFTSCPSIHSAMSSLLFFFVCFYSRYPWFKLVAFVYLLGEWWSAMYLDHHWRIDILMGLGCSVFTWTILLRLKRFGILAIQEKYYKLRLRNNVCTKEISQDKEGDGVTTMGMRLFSNTRLQNFFDPLA